MDALHFWSMAIQVVNLAIVLFILKKFLFDPYLKIVDKVEAEQEEIDRIYAIIDKIKKDAQEEASKILWDATTRATEIRESAVENAQKHADKLIADAEKKAELALEKANHEIKSIELEFQKRMKEGVMTAAVSLNKKLLGQSNTARQDFMKAHLEEVIK
jgi:F-type H+-transporting ATPase subunit b